MLFELTQEERMFLQNYAEFLEEEIIDNVEQLHSDIECEDIEELIYQNNEGDDGFEEGMKFKRMDLDHFQRMLKTNIKEYRFDIYSKVYELYKEMKKSKIEAMKEQFIIGEIFSEGLSETDANPKELYFESLVYNKEHYKSLDDNEKIYYLIELSIEGIMNANDNFKDGISEMNFA